MITFVYVQFLMDTLLIPSRSYTAGNLIREIRGILTKRECKDNGGKPEVDCLIVTMLQNGKRFASLLFMHPKFTYVMTSMLFHDETHVLKVVKQHNTYVNDNVCSSAHIVVLCAALHTG